MGQWRMELDGPADRLAWLDRFDDVESGHLVLEVPDEDDADYGAILDRADERLERLAGVASIFNQGPTRVRLTGRIEGPSGAVSVVVRSATVSINVSIRSPVVTVTSADGTVRRTDDWVTWAASAASTDERIADVLRLVQADLDWGEAYKVVEALNALVRSRLGDGLDAQPWVDSKALSRFKGTTQLYRHHKPSNAHPDPMGWKDASAYVFSLAATCLSQLQRIESDGLA